MGVRYELTVVILMVLVHQSVQLRSTHPLHEVVDRINNHGGPYIGLVLAFPAEQVPLLNSGLFVPNSRNPFIQLSG